YHAWCGAALAVGGIVCAGSKENMLVLLLPSVAIAVRARWTGSRRWLPLGCAPHVTLGLFVAIAAYLGGARYGHGYKEDVSTTGRLDLIVDAAIAIVREGWVWLVTGSIAAISGVMALRARGRFSDAHRLARSLAWTAALLALAALVYLSQVAFYNGW